MGETAMAITEADIKGGLDAGAVRLVVNPLEGCGTVAEIGGSVIWIGDAEGLRLSPKEYLETLGTDEVASRITASLRRLAGGDAFRADAEYCVIALNLLRARR